MFFNRKLKIFLSIILTLAVFSSTEAAFATYETDAEVTSEAVYMVYMGENGDMPVYSKNEQKKMYPASLTKIMTAIVLLENEPDLSKTVTVDSSVFSDFYDENGYYQYPSTADFQTGEVVELNDLLYGMMLQSACEAANIIAYDVGKTKISEFVEMMNETAKRIGAKNTHFTNPHGLFNSDQYTTAYDMYLITKYAMSFEKFKEVATSPTYELKATNIHPEPRTVTHTNYMMSKYLGGTEYYYPYASGIKTGTLDEAGRCLVSTASKDGYNYLIVSMGAPLTDENGEKYFYNFSDHIGLYEWAFKKFTLTKLVSANEDIMEFPVGVSAGKDYVIADAETDYITLLPYDFDMSQMTVELPEAKKINAPVEKGEVLGEMKISVDGEYITSVNLVASQQVKRSTVKYILWICKEVLASKFMIAVYIILVILIIAYIILFNKTNKKKKKLRSRRQANK